MGEVVWFINVQMIMQIVMYDAGELLKIFASYCWKMKHRNSFILIMFTTVVELNYIDLCFLSMISTYSSTNILTDSITPFF